MKNLNLILFIFLTVLAFGSHAETMTVKDGAGETKYLSVEGAGTTSDPYKTVRIEEYHPLYLAEQEILNTYGDTVSVADKKKRLIKFGRNDNISTSFETVWLRGGDETYVSTDLIDSISSSNAGDTQSVKIEGHTCSGGLPTGFVIQSITLNGQTKTGLTTDLCRSSRIYNDDSTDFSGTVYVYEDSAVSGGVPSDSTKIHLQTDGSNNQSLKAASSISSTDYYIVTDLLVMVNRQNTRSVDFKFQVREPGKVFRSRLSLACHSYKGTCHYPLDTPLIIPKSSDFRFRAISSGNTTGVEASAIGYLASVQ